MSRRAIGIYREPEFSPGKVTADAAIMDASLRELARDGWECTALDSAAFCALDNARADVILAMCQSDGRLGRPQYVTVAAYVWHRANSASRILNRSAISAS